MSMEDIIQLMKAQKEEQKLDLEAMFARQRDKQKKNRENEKAELVKDIRKGIKEEIRSEMKPLEERTTKIETATENMLDKVNKLMKKVNTLEKENSITKRKKVTVKQSGTGSRRGQVLKHQRCTKRTKKMTLRALR